MGMSRRRPVVIAQVLDQDHGERARVGRWAAAGRGEDSNKRAGARKESLNNTNDSGQGSSGRSSSDRQQQGE